MSCGLTTTTCGALGASLVWMPRPATIGIPSVEKNPGVTTRISAAVRLSGVLGGRSLRSNVSRMPFSDSGRPNASAEPSTFGNARTRSSSRLAKVIACRSQGYFVAGSEMLIVTTFSGR